MNIAIHAARIIPAFVLTLTLGSFKPVNDQAQNADFMLALPRVEVDVAADGVISIAGVSTLALESMTAGIVRAQRVPQGWVDYFVSTNTQHIELLQKDDGMYVWRNGKRLPNLNYDRRSLNTLRAVADQTGAFEAAGLDPRAADTLERVIPLLRRIGLNLLVRFPLRPGAQPVAPRSVRLQTHPASAAVKQNPSGKFDVVLAYDRNGDPAVFGLSPEDVRAIFNVDASEFALEQWLIDDLARRNVQHIGFRSSGDGLTVRVNGETLMTLQCDAECLDNLGEAFSVLNTYEEYEYLNEPVKAFAPYLKQIDASFVLRFPVPAGQTPVEIPVK